eukprot:12710415-Ditylum_brightwellii.AAC.1
MSRDASPTISLLQHPSFYSKATIEFETKMLESPQYDSIAEFTDSEDCDADSSPQFQCRTEDEALL